LTQELGPSADEDAKGAGVLILEAGHLLAAAIHLALQFILLVAVPICMRRGGGSVSE